MKFKLRGVLQRVRARLTRSRPRGPEVECLGNADAPAVLIFSEHINATYFISFDIPLRGMHAVGEINFAAISQATAVQWGVDEWKAWARVNRPDVVVLTRYGQADGIGVLDHFKRQGTRVIYHIDDDLLHIPESLGADIAARHGAESVIRARESMLRGCDLIYASTAHLARLMKARFPGQPVFHGMYAPYMRPWLPVPQARALPAGAGHTQVIGYMGSRGHARDLALAVPAIERLLDERPHLRFETFGTIAMPQRLRRFGDRVHSHAVNRSYAEFLGVLASLGWNAGLAPLEEVEFNHCKAPTKFIEYTAAGIPVVASRSPVYGMAMPPGTGLLVDGPDGWYEAMAAVLDQPGLGGALTAGADAHCATEFALEKLQRQLRGVVLGKP